jgi:prepilin-type N-terminal cleavage/methylation domain-containing protein
MAFCQGRNRALKSSSGFTLIELLIVISILGVLAAVVVLNVIGFMSSGRVEAKAVELKQVHTATGAYLFEGMPLASTATVGPDNLGILTDYLTGSLKYFWSIDSDGSVHEIFFASASDSLGGFTLDPDGGISWTGDFTTDGTQGVILATGGLWNDDFTFETTATFTSDDSFGMYYLSDSDASDGYILQYVPGAGFTVSTVTDGLITAIDDAPPFMPPGFLPGGSHSISVSVSGNSHTINVDGQTMTFDDSTYSSGTMGLQSAAGSNVNFTSFTVSPP